MIYIILIIFFLKTTHYDDLLMNAHMPKGTTEMERRFRSEQ